MRAKAISRQGSMFRSAREEGIGGRHESVHFPRRTMAASLWPNFVPRGTKFRPGKACGLASFRGLNHFAPAQN
jgi:hypothetical protein